MVRRVWAVMILAAVIVALAGCGSAPSAVEETEQVFWGSAKSDKYHYTSCQWAQRIYPENRVVFRSGAEARTAGYVPCKTCQPPG